jgi:hypothetical protein
MMGELIVAGLAEAYGSGNAGFIVSQEMRDEDLDTRHNRMRKRKHARLQGLITQLTSL